MSGSRTRAPEGDFIHTQDEQYKHGENPECLSWEAVIFSGKESGSLTRV